MGNELHEHLRKIFETARWRVVYYSGLASKEDRKEFKNVEFALYQPDIHPVGINPESWPGILESGHVVDEITPKEGKYHRLAVAEEEVERARALIALVLNRKYPGLDYGE